MKPLSHRSAIVTGASRAFLGDAWQWWVLPVGGMISVTVLSLVLISYGVEGGKRRGV